MFYAIYAEDIDGEGAMAISDESHEAAFSRIIERTGIEPTSISCRAFDNRDDAMAFLFGEWYMCGGIITNRERLKNPRIREEFEYLLNIMGER